MFKKLTIMTTALVILMAAGVLQAQPRTSRGKRKDQQVERKRPQEIKKKADWPGDWQPAVQRETVPGLVPLCDMEADDKYKGQDGGLYGKGKNTPPTEHRVAALKELAKIQPIDAQGRPDPNGKIGLIVVGVSNTSVEFTTFKRIADEDPEKSTSVVIVNTAQAWCDVSVWADANGINPSPERLRVFKDVFGKPVWENADGRIKDAGLTPQQVQVVWIKQAVVGPGGGFPAHAEKFKESLGKVLRIAKKRYPNLRIAYLSSRIYAGNARGPLSPEPYAYEYAYSVRWLIQDQIKGGPNLNYDPARGKVKTPLLLWGPYLWANGTSRRKTDGFVWKAEDFRNDGVHPSRSGCRKVAGLLLDFFKKDPLAKSWFLKNSN